MAYARRRRAPSDRTRILVICAGTVVAALMVRLFSLQVLHYGFYRALAEGQHSFFQQLFPERGKVYLTEHDGKQLYPIATNEPLNLVYANPQKINGDRRVIARNLATILDLDEETVFSRISKTNDQYEPLKHAVRADVIAELTALRYDGIVWNDELVRFYPEGRYGSHVVGFLGFDKSQRRGQYGIEGAFDKELAGVSGHLEAPGDGGGPWIPVAGQSFVPTQHGSDIVLTIDRAIQHEACTRLDQAVEKHGADGGAVVVLDSTTGAVLALCGSPDFDPNDYARVDDQSVFLNPAIVKQYEPGSIFKAITMAAALDLGKVTPGTTYTDYGTVKFGSFTIRNSDGEAHGVQTMTNVLEQSLNTGAIFAMLQVGPRQFESYVKKFGFGEKTGVELQGEVAGNVSSLRSGKDIFAATGSYGQGITVTPLQLAAAYGAIANRGILMKPFIVKKIMRPDGTSLETKPHEIGPVIAPETATTLTAMLVNVIRNGHGKRAGVSGYYLAGKTGTAQVPKSDGPGYEENVSIGSFGGFGPVENPRFVMVVRIDRPRDVQFAESTAAPLFGEIADFILRYFEIPPTVSGE